MASQSDRWLISVDLDTTGIQRGLAGVNGMLNALTSGVGGPDGGGQPALPPVTNLNSLGSPQTVATSAIANSQGEMRELMAAQGQVAALMQAQLAASSRVVGRQIQDLNRFGEVYFERLKNQIRGFNFFPSQQQAAIQQTFASAFQRKSQELMTSLQAIRIEDISTVFNRRLDREASLIAANAALSPVLTQRNVTGTVPLPADVRTYGRELERLMATNAALVRRHTGLLEQTNALQSGIIRSQQEVIAANRYAAQTTRDRVARSYNQVLAVSVGRPEQPRELPPAPVVATAPLRTPLPARTSEPQRSLPLVIAPPIAPAVVRQRERQSAQTFVTSPVTAGGGALVPTRNGFSSYGNSGTALSAAEQALINSLNTKSQALDRQTSVITSNYTRFTQAELGLITALERKAAEVNGLPAAGVPNVASSFSNVLTGSRAPLMLGAASPIVPPPYVQKQLPAGNALLGVNEVISSAGQRFTNALTNQDLTRARQMMSLPGGSWDRFSSSQVQFGRTPWGPQDSLPLPQATWYGTSSLWNLPQMRRQFNEFTPVNWMGLEKLGSGIQANAYQYSTNRDRFVARWPHNEYGFDDLASRTHTLRRGLGVPGIEQLAYSYLWENRENIPITQLAPGQSLGRIGKGQLSPSVRDVLNLQASLEQMATRQLAPDVFDDNNFTWDQRRGFTVLDYNDASGWNDLERGNGSVDGKPWSRSELATYNVTSGLTMLANRLKEDGTYSSNRLALRTIEQSLEQLALPAGAGDRFSTGGAKDFARTVIPFDLEGLPAELQLTRGAPGVNYYTSSGRPIMSFQNPKLDGRGLTKFNPSNKSTNGLALNDLLDEYLGLAGSLRQTDAGFSGYREEFESLFDRNGYSNRFSEFSQRLFDANRMQGARLTRGQAIPILEDGSVGFGGLLGQSDRLYSYTSYPKVATEYGLPDGYSRDARGRGSLGALVSVGLPSAAIASFDLIGAQTPAFTGNYDPFDLNKLLGAEILAPGLGRNALPDTVITQVEQFVAVTDAWREAAGKLRRREPLGFQEFLALPAGSGDRFSSTNSANEAAFNRERQRYQGLREAGNEAFFRSTGQRSLPPQGYYWPASGSPRAELFRTGPAQQLVDRLMGGDVSTIGGILRGVPVPFVSDNSPFRTAAGRRIAWGTSDELGGDARLLPDGTQQRAKARPASIVLPRVEAPSGELGALVAGIFSKLSEGRGYQKLFPTDLSNPTPLGQPLTFDRQDYKFFNPSELSFVPYRSITGFNALNGGIPNVQPLAQSLVSAVQRISSGTYSSLTGPRFNDRFALLNNARQLALGTGPLSAENIYDRFSTAPTPQAAASIPEVYRQRLQTGMAYLDLMTGGMASAKTPGGVAFGDLPDGRIGVSRADGGVVISPNTIGTTAQRLGVAGGNLSGWGATVVHEVVGHNILGSERAQRVFGQGLQLSGDGTVVGTGGLGFPSAQSMDTLGEYISEMATAIAGGNASGLTRQWWDQRIGEAGFSSLSSGNLEVLGQGLREIDSGASLNDVAARLAPQLEALGISLEGLTASAAAATGAQAADTAATAAHTQAVAADTAVTAASIPANVGALPFIEKRRLAAGLGLEVAGAPVLTTGVPKKGQTGAALTAALEAARDAATPVTAAGGDGGAKPPITPPPVTGGPAALPPRGGTGSGRQEPKPPPRVYTTQEREAAARRAAELQARIDALQAQKPPKLTGARNELSREAWEQSRQGDVNATQERINRLRNQYGLTDDFIAGVTGAGGSTGSGPFTAGPADDPRGARQRRSGTRWNAMSREEQDAVTQARLDAQRARLAALSDPSYRRSAMATAAAARGVNRIDLTGLTSAQQKAIDSNILPFFGDGSDYRRQEAWRLSQSGSFTRAQQLRGQIREFALERDADGNVQTRRRTRAEIGDAAERAAALQNRARAYGTTAEQRARDSSRASNIISEFGLTPEDVAIIGQSQTTVRTQRTQSRFRAASEFWRDIATDPDAMRASGYNPEGQSKSTRTGRTYTTQESLERLARLNESRAQSYGARSTGFIDDEWARRGFPLPEAGAGGGGRRGGGGAGGRSGGGAGDSYGGFGNTGGDGLFARMRQAVRGDAGVGGFFGQGLLSTIQYGVPGMLLYGGMSALSNSFREAEELKYNLARLENQMNATFGDEAANKIRNVRAAIMELAVETGIGADQIAEMEIKIRGAFEGETIDGLSGESLITSQRNATAKLAAVTGLSPKEAGDGLIAASLAFDASNQRIGDIATGIEAKTGVPASELIAFLGDVAPVAADAGFSVEEISALAGVTLQRSGRTGASLAEAYGRVLPAMSAAKPQIQELVSLTPSLQTPEMIDALREGNVADQLRLLAQGFGDLDKSSQDFLINLLGGRREAQAIISVFNNSDKVAELFETANNSAGELDERFAKLRNTLTNTLARLGEQFRGLTIAILDAGLADMFGIVLASIGGILSLTTPLLNAVVGINEALGGWPSRLLAALALFKLLQFGANKFRPELSAAFPQVASTIGGVGGGRGRRGPMVPPVPAGGLGGGGGFWSTQANQPASVPSRRGRLAGVAQGVGSVATSVGNVFSNSWQRTLANNPLGQTVGPINAYRNAGGPSLFAGMASAWERNVANFRSIGEWRRGIQAARQDVPIGGPGPRTRLQPGAPLPPGVAGPTLPTFGGPVGFGLSRPGLRGFESVRAGLRGVNSGFLGRYNALRQGSGALFGTPLGSFTIPLQPGQPVPEGAGRVPGAGPGASRPQAFRLAIRQSLGQGGFGAGAGTGLGRGLAAAGGAGLRVAGGALLSGAQAFAASPLAGLLIAATAYQLISGRIEQDAEQLSKLAEEQQSIIDNARKLSDESGSLQPIAQAVGEIGERAEDAYRTQSAWDRGWRTLLRQTSEGDVLNVQQQLAAMDPQVAENLPRLANLSTTSQRDGLRAALYSGSASSDFRNIQNDLDSVFENVGDQGWWDSRDAFTRTQIQEDFGDRLTPGANAVVARIFDAAGITEGGALEGDVLAAATRDDPYAALQTLISDKQTTPQEAEQAIALIDSLGRGALNDPEVRKALEDMADAELTATEKMNKKISELEALRSAGAISLDAYARRGAATLAAARNSLLGGKTKGASDEELAAFFNEQQAYNQQISAVRQELAQQRLEEFEAFNSSDSDVAEESKRSNADLLRRNQLPDPDARRSAALTLIEATKSFYASLIAQATDQAEAQRILEQMRNDPDFALAIQTIEQAKIQTTSEYKVGAGYYQQLRNSGTALDSEIGPDTLFSLAQQDLAANGGSYSEGFLSTLQGQVDSIEAAYAAAKEAGGGTVPEGTAKNLGGALSFVLQRLAEGGVDVYSLGIDSGLLDSALATNSSATREIPKTPDDGETFNRVIDGQDYEYKFNAKTGQWEASRIGTSTGRGGTRETRTAAPELNLTADQARQEGLYTATETILDLKVPDPTDQRRRFFNPATRQYMRENEDGTTEVDPNQYAERRQGEDGLYYRFKPGILPGVGSWEVDQDQNDYGTPWEAMSPEERRAEAQRQQEAKKKAEAQTAYDGNRRRISTGGALRYAQREFEGASDTELALINVDIAKQTMDAAETLGKDSEQYQQAAAEWYKAKTAMSEAIKADAAADGELAASYARLRKDSVGAARAQRKAAQDVLNAGNQDRNSNEFKQNQAALNDAIGAENDAIRQKDLRRFDVVAAAAPQGAFTQALVAAARARRQKETAIGDDLVEADIALAEAERAIRQAQAQRVQSLYKLAQARSRDSLASSNIGLTAARAAAETAKAEYGADSGEYFDALAAVEEAENSQRQAYRARVEALFGLKKIRQGSDPLKGTQDDVTMLQQLLAVATEARDVDAQIELQGRLIEAQRAAADAQRDVRASLLDLRRAELEAMDDDVGAAQINAQQQRDILTAMIQRGDGAAAINRQRAAIVAADRQVRDAITQDKLDEYQYLLDTDKITRSQYVNYLTALKNTLDPATDQFKDLEVTLKRLKDDLSANLQANLPTSLALPTLYEVRRLNQTGGGDASQMGGGIGYQDNRIVNIVINDVTPDVKGQVVDALYDALGTGRNGYSPRSY